MAASGPTIGGTAIRGTAIRGTAIRGTVAAAAAGAVLVLAGIAGCSSAASAGAGGASCGQTRTGVNVPVTIEVTKGDVGCGTALHVEQAYAAAIRKGSLRGNGGGAPVTVDGWTCQAYATEQVLRTGDASECHTASAEVVAELAVPSSSPSAGS